MAYDAVKGGLVAKAPHPFDAIKWLYHFTDTRNVPLILQHGGLWSLREQAQKGISFVAPGGDADSQRNDREKGWDRYVHCCLHPENPMEFRKKQKGEIGESLFIRIDLAVLHNEGVRFIPGFSNTNGIQDYGLADAFSAGVVDVAPLYSFDYSRVERWKAAKKFSILVPDHIPLGQLLNLSNG